MATLKSSGGPELERALRELALRGLIGRPAPQLSEAMAGSFMQLVVVPELYPAKYSAWIDLDQLGQRPPRHDRNLAEGDPHEVRTRAGRNLGERSTATSSTPPACCSNVRRRKWSHACFTAQIHFVTCVASRMS
jgi:hypothetical protein